MLLKRESLLLAGLPALVPRAVKLPTKQASFKPNRVQNNKKERENGRDGGRGTHNVPQYIAALQRLKCVT